MLAILKYLFKGEKVNYQDLLKRNPLLIDVRSPSEFAQGQVEGSVNIPLNAISTHLRELKGLEKPVIVFCRSGARSAQASQLLKNAGIETYNGGGWNQVQRELDRFNT